MPFFTNIATQCFVCSAWTVRRISCPPKIVCCSSFLFLVGILSWGPALPSVFSVLQSYFAAIYVPLHDTFICSSFLVVMLVKFKFSTCFPVWSSLNTSFLVRLGIRDGYLRKADWDRVVWRERFHEELFDSTHVFEWGKQKKLNILKIEKNLNSLLRK
jgi:hypothetical protein